jgi:tetratricopeptide (TPR) repeat protein
MPRVRRTLRHAPLVALLLAAAPIRAHAAPPVALPDTGLFAPVAEQYEARTHVLEELASRPLEPEAVLLLLATGQPDRADSLLRSAAAPGRAMRVAGGRVAMARQDFAAVQALLASLEARSGLLPRERSLRYQFLFARDDEAGIDSLAHARIGHVGDTDAIPDLLAAGRVAYDMLDYPRAETLFTRALAATPSGSLRPAWGDSTSARRALALTGLGLVQQKKRDWDGSLATLRSALAEDASADVLMALTETLIRLGRTDEAISAAEWAVRLAPYNDAAHYLLGNGYARKNYSQLFAAYPSAFADAAGRKEIDAADAMLAAGDRAGARAAYAKLVAAHPGWADARVRLASLDFEDGRFAPSRDGCFAALRACPEYGRAHAVLAKALEAQRFAVDVHRAGYEARFAAAPMPVLPGIERFVVNWRSLSPRHQKRVALSIAPWKAYLPVLIEGGSTFYIKPVYMLLSDCPDQQTLHDQRISYDSRLWDDVRGCGGYHTVTGIEDVERTIFDRYNTVLHELTHQVHAMLPADDSRLIQELYAKAKQRDDSTKNGYLSRYAGGSVYEYFAEGANSLESPMRDAYDPREVVRERLDRIDPALRKRVEAFMARTDVSASYPIAYAAGGDDRVERGKIDEAVPLYQKALARDSTNETALVALSRALLLGNRAVFAGQAAGRAVAAHPESGPARIAVGDAQSHIRALPDEAIRYLRAHRGDVRREDRYEVDAEIGRMAWVLGDTATSLAAFDSVLAYQSDNPEGLQGRAAALALAGRSDEAIRQYERAVRMRTGVVELRCAYARDLLRMGRPGAARAQLDAAKLLDEQNPTAEALRAWADLAESHLDTAREHARQALAWGEWCDLARIVLGGIAQRSGDSVGARAAWAPVEERIQGGERPEYVYRPALAVWEEIHVLPAVERGTLASFRGH